MTSIGGYLDKRLGGGAEVRPEPRGRRSSAG
jgi:hypothetical protein